MYLPVFTMFSYPFCAFLNHFIRYSRVVHFLGVAESFRILPGVGEHIRSIRNICVLQWFIEYVPSAIRPRAHKHRVHKNVHDGFANRFQRKRLSGRFKGVRKDWESL